VTEPRKDPTNPVDFQRLQDSPILVALTEEQIRRLFEVGNLEMYGDGESIIQEGGIGDSMFLILDGEVAISTQSAANLAVLSGDSSLQSQYEGDFFGEMAILDHEARSATVRAKGQAVVFRIPRDGLHEIFNTDTDFHVVFLTNLSRLLSRRLRITNMRARGVDPFAS
jgi:CRP-like cAMP-binding protein